MGPEVATQELLASVEGFDFRISVDDAASVILSTHLCYDLHVRPTTYIYARLRDAGVVAQLRLRHGPRDPWVSLEPLSVLTLGLRCGDEVQIRVPSSVSRAMLRTVMEAFRSCPRYRNYVATSHEEHECPAVSAEAEAFEQFQREFDASDDRSHLLKLHIENFIIGHLAEIEAFMREHRPSVPPGRQELDETFRHLLYGAFEHFGMSSLDVPYDNLMQIRDMCYHLHFRQVESGRKLPYTLVNLEWSREHGQRWRRTQGLRQRYFYDRESAYYRDLFLVLVSREPSRLRDLIARWHERLDYSLALRSALREEIGKFGREMQPFSPNFDNPEEFSRHIEAVGELVIANVSRLTPFLSLVREGRIYLGGDRTS
ncbi:MAG: hypothetical protein AAB426_02665 [Myxococcota bacterium]